MDGTEAGASSNGPSVEEVSISVSVSEAGAACLPVPEASAGSAECPVDQIGQSLKQLITPRVPFNEDPQAVPEDLIDLM